MIATSHVIIGGAVGVAVGLLTQNPLAALVAGIASHLICDAIPHLDVPPGSQGRNGELLWTPRLWTFALTDSGIAALIAMSFWVTRFHFPFFTPFVAGAIGGYLPDFVDNVPFWNKMVRSWPGFKQFHDFHDAIHAFWRRYYPMPQYSTLGVFTQLVLISISLWFLLTH